MAASMQGPTPVQAKKANVIVWIIVGLLGLVMVAGVVVVAGGLFVAKKFHDAASNPALTAAKVMAAANPDVEILSIDDSKGTVTFKDKKSGKVITLDFDQIKQGRIVFEEDGKKVTVDSTTNGVNLTDNDGSTVQIGSNASARLPAWLPAYPGSNAQGTFAIQGAGQSGAAVSFTTKDRVDKVSSFYDGALRKAGFTTNVNLMQQDGKTSGAMITAESDDKRRTTVVNIAAGDDDATVSITYSDKK
jgi:hypothetical protein